MALSRRTVIVGLIATTVVCGVVLFLFLRDYTAVPTSVSPDKADSKSGSGSNSTADSLKPLQRPTDWFETATVKTGIDWTYRNGREANRYTILESLGGGAAALDYDRDGLIDLFFTGGGRIEGLRVFGNPSSLYRNLGDWTFAGVSQVAAVSEGGDYSHGCTVADFDSDGFPDLFVCCYGRSRLYRNLGDGTFRDETEKSGLTGSGWSTAAAWADVDNDGFSDLYVARYLQWSPATDRKCVNRDGVRDVCSPRKFPAADDRLFRNRGDGTFEDFSRKGGLKPGGNGLGVVAADLNGDGHIDLYVANDETDNFLYLGGPGGRLSEVAQRAGVATNEYGMHDGSMGLDVADVDGDGRPDLWVTNFEREDNVLYRNLGGGQFTSAIVPMGLAGHSRPFVGFGTAIADFDGDTWPDLVVANGHVFYHTGMMPYRQPAQLFRNLNGRRFENVSKSGGSYFRGQHVGRGLLVADLDNDGALDIVVVHQNAPIAVLRNRRSPRHFSRVELHGRECNRDAIGASLSCRIGGRTVVWHLGNGNGYFSHSDKRIILPLAQSRTVEVTVRWPQDHIEVFQVRASRRSQCLIQGTGKWIHGK